MILTALENEIQVTLIPPLQYTVFARDMQILNFLLEIFRVYLHHYSKQETAMEIVCKC
jgi:hypothetical protein